MKRKALFTSTALLLVALICLATASYAWFTADSGAEIDTFKVNVGGSDGVGITLAAVPYRTATGDENVADNQFYSTLTAGTDAAESWNGISEASFPADLKAVSNYGTLDFFPAEYDGKISGVDHWTTEESSVDNVVLFSFLAKADNAGTYDMSVDFSTHANFTKAVKFEYAVTAPGTAVSSSNLFGNRYALIANEETYSECKASGLDVMRSGNGFAPDTTATGYDATNFVVTNATNVWTNSSVATITFTNDALVKRVTIAVWLEGMDKDCQGTWSLDEQDISITFAEHTAG